MIGQSVRHAGKTPTLEDRTALVGPGAALTVDRPPVFHPGIIAICSSGAKLPTRSPGMRPPPGGWPEASASVSRGLSGARQLLIVEPPPRPSRPEKYV